MFQGNTMQIMKHTALAVVLSGLAASAGLMGPSWMRFLLFGAVLILPVLLVLPPLVRRLNRFSFDDEKAEIVKPGGKRLPYGRVRGLLVLERGTTIDVYARLGALHTTSLVLSLDAAERQRVAGELAQRLPGAALTTKRRLPYGPALVLPLVLAAVFAGAHAFLYLRHPALKPAPRLLEASTAGKAAHPKRQPRDRAGGFQFELPAGYAFIGEGEGTLSFEDPSRKTRLEIITNVRREEMARFAFWYRYGMGVRNYADLASYVYRSRYGVVPLYLRALALIRQEDVVLYETAPPLLRGYVTQGRHGRDELTHIFLYGRGQELHLYFSGPGRVPEEALRTIITNIRTVLPARSGA